MTRNLARRRAGWVAGLAVAAIAASCGRSEQREPAASAVVTVRIEEVRTSPVPDSYEAAGTIRSRRTSVLSSRIVARVLAVHVREGDSVERGRSLVELDARDVTAELRKAEAGLHVAEATYRRYGSLLERGSASRQEFEEVEARYRAAQADAAAARAAASYARIRSPIDGVVAAKTVEIGSLAAPGVPLLTIEDDSAYRLEVPVEESRLAAIRPGQAVEAAVDALGADLSGRVAEIVPAADARSRTFVVKIDLPADPRLRSGMFGRARFAGAPTTALTVPSSAVVERGPLTALYAVDAGDTARLRLVRLGRRFDERVEVLSGLEAGERVIAERAAGLRDGLRVAGKPAAPEPAR
ncbi:MAG: efflux RND transporter periplasmic adaptor subunit [Deltaproteobacteria bacterium]|nr:efflux RND transporter periplasmic adaptor subunit [Deltaproteobacteria bacterium]